MQSRNALVAASLMATLACVFGRVPSAAAAVDYAREIKATLKARCYACHGALKQEAGLRLDTGMAIRAGGDSGPAVVPGDRKDHSLLLRRVTAAADEGRMPPEGEPLSEAEIAGLRQWIASGAASPADEAAEPDPRRHWAFLPPVRPQLPAIDGPVWSRNPIDRLVARRHQELGVRPLPEADRALLLRRVYLDLIGLPPTPAQLASFLQDESPQAYERVVDQLLSSPHYGERWGRHWMDVWRYSDWYGRRQVGDVRNSYPHIWRWRDWIIDSLNQDKGYDQMVREMLAADELYPADDQRLPALGFIVRNWFSLNYDVWKQDLVEHTGKAFLGLRLNCAHCHDHKYDPLSQEEYFRFRAVFEPLELRHDRVPGGPALSKYTRYVPGSSGSLKPIAAGLPRVYDHDLDAETRMYRLGDPRDTLERPPVAPGAPAILGDIPFDVQPVSLPPVAWYPGLKTFIREAETQRVQQAVAEANAEVGEAAQKLASILPQLAAAQRELAEAQAAQPRREAARRNPRDLIAWWRFEVPSTSHDQAVADPASQSPDARLHVNDAASPFFADSSGNGHQLTRVTGESPPVDRFALAESDRRSFRLSAAAHAGTTAPEASATPETSATGATGAADRSLLHRLPNRSAAQFRQADSFGYLQAAGDPAYYVNEFTLEALVHFDVAQRNFNRTIAAYEGSWTLLHRGLDERRFELRLLYSPESGDRVDLATGDQLVLETARDYYVALVLSADDVTFWAADLTAGSPLRSVRFPRAQPGTPPLPLARPPAATPLKIGNSDGTGRVVGLIDEVRYTRGALSGSQLAAELGTTWEPGTEAAASRLSALQKEHQLAQQAVALAEARRSARQAEAAALALRIAADQFRYQPQHSTSPASPAPQDSPQQEAPQQEAPQQEALPDARVAAAIRRAVEAERDAALAAARAEQLGCQHALERLRRAAQTDAQTDAQAIAKAEQKFAAARTARAQLENSQLPDDYQPLGPQYPRTSSGRRAALARWLTHPAHPLTARVAVNHLWLRHFGRPLVESVFDFGRSGTAPTHPELLDWLACELMDGRGGWKMKPLHRLIVTSRTYRLSSRPGAAHPNDQRDPENASWWKFERRRLEAETIRDSMLHVADRLDTTLGGPEIPTDQEAQSLRRSLYFAIYPEAGGTMRFLTLFDPPSPDDCYRRTESIVPQQALAGFNSELTLAQARHLVGKISAEAKSTSFVTAAFLRILCRPPTAAETAACETFLARQQELYQKRQLNLPPPQAADRAQRSLVRALLNHNDFLTIH